ncbi:hypothetical protein OHA21_49395 [Actinoplanes sp. NBC_00393]|uniref:hypothetical protein n=1 Tax=Actinoplanes sp. NBC_00393 TaxID=2975953 RepID=UPI002E1DA5EB
MLLAAVFVVPPAMPVPAEIPPPLPLPVAATITSGSETTVVVDLISDPPAATSTATVTHDGAAQTARLEPVVADGLAVTLVVDASAAGAATLPAWLSAAARFVLAAPGGTRAVIIPDRAPAAVVGPPQRGSYGIVRSLNTVRSGGERDTAAALELAGQQFPETAAGRRVVLLYTTAADAGGLSADRLAARYRTAGTILVVVGTAAAGPYWSAAAAGTGGFFAPAGDPVVVPALDQVETTLSGRYLVRFPTPPDLPARVEVTVNTGDSTFTGEAVVAEQPGSSSPRNWLLAAAAAGLFLLLIAVILRSRRASRRSAPTSPAAGRPTSPAPVGRASSPAPVGRASSPARGGRASSPAAGGRASSPAPGGGASSPASAGQPASSTPAGQRMSAALAGRATSAAGPRRPRAGADRSASSAASGQPAGSAARGPSGGLGSPEPSAHGDPGRSGLRSGRPDRLVGGELGGTADRPVTGDFGAGPRSPNPMSPPAQGRATVPNGSSPPDAESSPDPPEEAL